MKLAIAAALLVFSQFALAQTNVILSSDKATILMLAMNSNPDATALDSAISAQSQDENGKLVKSLDFKTSDGKPAFDIQCVFSKLVPGEGSCITVIQATSNLQMDTQNNRLKFHLEGADAAALAEFFVLPQDGTRIYVSSDNKMVIDAARDSSGAIDSFTVTYGY